MTKKENKSIKIPRSEVVYYRMLITLAVLITVIFTIVSLTDTAEGYNSFLLNIAPKTAVISAIACVPLLAFFIICKARRVDDKQWVVSSGYLLSVALWVTSVFGLYGFLSSRTSMAYIVVTAALYFVYYLFDREFFIYSLYSALGAAALVSINSASTVEHIISAVLAFVLTGAVLYFVFSKAEKPAKAKSGKKAAKRSVKGFKPAPFLVSAAVLLVGTVLSFFFAGVSFYSLVVLFAVYLIFTIVNTVKMM